MQQDPSMSSPIRYDLGADRVVTIIFDAPDAPVNTMTEAWIRALHDTLDRLEAERDSYDGVIIASAKKTFFAGAELKEVLKFTLVGFPGYPRLVAAGGLLWLVADGERLVQMAWQVFANIGWIWVI